MSRSSRRRLTANLIRIATSAPAWATRATGCTGRDDASTCFAAGCWRERSHSVMIGHGAQVSLEERAPNAQTGTAGFWDGVADRRLGLRAERASPLGGRTLATFRRAGSGRGTARDSQAAAQPV